MSYLSDRYSKNFSKAKKADFNRRFSKDYDPNMTELSNILRILAEMRQGSAEGGIMRAAYNQAGLVNSDIKKIGQIFVEDRTLPEILKEKALEKALENQPKKIDKEAEMFKTVEEFKKLKSEFKKLKSESDNPFFRAMNLDTFKEIKKKQKNLFSNKLIELNLKYPDKKFITDDGFVDKKLAKETIDQAIGELELSPIEGLTLVRAINTQGDQSETSGTFNIGNFNFVSPNIEEGILQTDAAFNFGNLNLTGKADTKDSKLLKSELGFNLNNELMGSLINTDDSRKTKLGFNKKFNLPNNFTIGAAGNVDTSTIDGKTYKSSDLTPSLSYNDGILSADISKEILKGGSTPNLNVGFAIPINQKKFEGDLILDSEGKVQFDNDGRVLRKPDYTKDLGVITLRGSDLLSDNKGGTIGYQKEFGKKDDNLFFTIGGEKSLFDDDYTAGAGIKLKFEKGGLARMLGE